MAVTPNSFIAAQGFRTVVVQFAPADTTVLKDIISAGSNGSKLVGLIATSTDSATKVPQVYIHNGSIALLLGSTLVAIAAGNDGTTAAVDLLGVTLNPGVPLDNDGQHYVLLPSGYKLQVGMLATITAAKVINITAFVEDF